MAICPHQPHYTQLGWLLEEIPWPNLLSTFSQEFSYKSAWFTFVVSHSSLDVDNHLHSSAIQCLIQRVPLPLWTWMSIVATGQMGGQEFHRRPQLIMLMNYIVTQLGHNVYYKSPKKVQTRSENSSPLTLMSDDEEDVDKVQIAPLSHTHLKMCLLWSMISLTQHLQ